LSLKTIFILLDNVVADASEAETSSKKANHSQFPLISSHIKTMSI